MKTSEKSRKTSEKKLKKTDIEKLFTIGKPSKSIETCHSRLSKVIDKTMRAQEKNHKFLLEAGAKALKIDLKKIEENHKKSDKLVLQTLKKNREVLLKKKPELRRRVANFRKITKKYMMAPYSYGSIGTNEKIFVCLWEADYSLRFGGGFDTNEVSTGIGANVCKHYGAMNSIQQAGNRQIQAGTCFILT